MSNILFYVSNILDKLHNAYSEEHRIYHNIGHISRMFSIADEMEIKLSSAQVVAIWFHDFVYIPKQKNNEELSVNAMNEIYQDSHPFFGSVINEASKIILDTKNEEIKQSSESGIVIDLDLWDLGNKRYWVNRDLIKDEFMPFCKDENEFKIGRLNWIRSMLARPSIFVTNYPTLEMERTAKMSLIKERDQLIRELDE